MMPPRRRSPPTFPDLVEHVGRPILDHGVMIRGTMAVHQAGHFWRYTWKTIPRPAQEAFWSHEPDPFPMCPDDGSPAVPYTPLLLPDERHLLYSSSQGLLLFDLWSFTRSRRRTTVPKARLIPCEPRSIVAPPIALNAGRLGVLSRGRNRRRVVARWVGTGVPPRPRKPTKPTRRFRDHLDSDAATASLPVRVAKCRCESVEGRVITFSTKKEHWVWRFADAAESKVDEMIRTWPGKGVGDHQESIIVDYEMGNVGTRPARVALFSSRNLTPTDFLRGSSSFDHTTSRRAIN